MVTGFYMEIEPAISITPPPTSGTLMVLSVQWLHPKARVTDPLAKGPAAVTTPTKACIDEMCVVLKIPWFSPRF